MTSWPPATASSTEHVGTPAGNAVDGLAASPRLQWLQIHSAGTDRPVYPPLFRRGVAITNASGASAATWSGVRVSGKSHPQELQDAFEV